MSSENWWSSGFLQRPRDLTSLEWSVGFRRKKWESSPRGNCSVADEWITICPSSQCKAMSNIWLYLMGNICGYIWLYHPVEGKLVISGYSCDCEPLWPWILVADDLAPPKKMEQSRMLAMAFSQENFQVFHCSCLGGCHSLIMFNPWFQLYQKNSGRPQDEVYPVLLASEDFQARTRKVKRELRGNLAGKTMGLPWFYHHAGVFCGCSL